VSSYLSDRAMIDFNTRERMKGSIGWDDFYAYMHTKYTPPNLATLIREKLRSIVQTTDVLDYHVEFEKLAVQAQDMNDAEKLSLFINGLLKISSNFVNHTTKY